MLLAFSLYIAIAFCFGLFVYLQVDRIMVRQTLVEIADDIKEELLELRRNEKNYIIRRDPLYLEKIDTVIKQLETNLTKVKPHLLTSFNEEEYQTLINAVTSYSALIDQFGQNYRTTASLTEELSKIGRTIEKKILAKDEYLLKKEILEIRLIEKNYILFQQAGYLLQLKKQVQSFQALLE